MPRKKKPDWTLKFAKDVDDKARKMMLEIRRDFHQRLVNYDISVLFFPEPKPGRGKEVLGTIGLATPREKLYGTADAFLYLAESWWKKAPVELREFLVDNLLSRLDVTSRGKLAIRPYDVEANLAVLQRRGIVNVELEAAQRIFQQLPLPLSLPQLGADAPAEEMTGRKRAVTAAVRDMCPTEEGASVTISAPGITDQTAVLTSETRRELNAILGGDGHEPEEEEDEDLTASEVCTICGMPLGDEHDAACPGDDGEVPLDEGLDEPEDDAPVEFRFRTEADVQAEREAMALGEAAGG